MYLPSIEYSCNKLTFIATAGDWSSSVEDRPCLCWVRTDPHLVATDTTGWHSCAGVHSGWYHTWGQTPSLGVRTCTSPMARQGQNGQTKRKTYRHKRMINLLFPNKFNISIIWYKYIFINMYTYSYVCSYILWNASDVPLDEWLTMHWTNCLVNDYATSSYMYQFISFQNVNNTRDIM